MLLWIVEYCKFHSWAAAGLIPPKVGWSPFLMSTFWSSWGRRKSSILSALFDRVGRDPQSKTWLMSSNFSPGSAKDQLCDVHCHRLPGLRILICKTKERMPPSFLTSYRPACHGGPNLQPPGIIFFLTLRPNWFISYPGRPVSALRCLKISGPPIPRSLLVPVNS